MHIKSGQHEAILPFSRSKTVKGVVQVFKIEWDFRGSEITIFANISISKWSHVQEKSCLFIVADVDIRK